MYYLSKVLSFYRLFADRAIFGLPGKEIEQRCQRLSNERKANPEDAVANDPPVDPIHLLQGSSYGD